VAELPCACGEEHILGGTAPWHGFIHGNRLAVRHPSPRLWERIARHAVRAVDMDYELGSKRLGPDGRSQSRSAVRAWPFSRSGRRTEEAVKHILLHTFFASCETRGANFVHSSRGGIR